MTKKENEDLKGKTLLVLSPFPDGRDEDIIGIFVKDQVNAIRGFFEKVYVIAPIPYVPGFLHYFLSGRVRARIKKRDYSYDNVEVIFPRYLKLPKRAFFDELFESAVKRAIRSNMIKFDIIHAHFAYPWGLVASKLGKRKKKSCLLTLGEDKIWLSKECKAKNRSWIDAFRGSDLIFRVNKSDIPMLEEYNKNVMHLPYGYNEKLFFSQDKESCRKRLGIAKGKKIIINVAALVISQKNQINLILAMKELLKKRTDVMLYLIGEGKDRHLVEEKIMELKLDNNVKLVGRVDHEKLSLYMDSSDLFVLPSYSEGFSVAQIEAMGCGLPTVATKNGGSEEIITSEKYGFLLDDPADYMALATLMFMALEKKWDKKAISSAVRGYTMTSIGKELIGIYSRFASGQCRKSA